MKRIYLLLVLCGLAFVVAPSCKKKHGCPSNNVKPMDLDNYKKKRK